MDGNCKFIELRKKLLIGDLGCIIKSMHSNEFIMHFPKFFDLRMQCERREDFLNLVKLRFAHLQPNVTLRVYGIVSLAIACFQHFIKRYLYIQKSANQNFKIDLLII